MRPTLLTFTCVIGFVVAVWGALGNAYSLVATHYVYHGDEHLSRSLSFPIVLAITALCIGRIYAAVLLFRGCRLGLKLAPYAVQLLKKYCKLQCGLVFLGLLLTFVWFTPKHLETNFYGSGNRLFREDGYINPRVAMLYVVPTVGAVVSLLMPGLVMLTLRRKNVKSAFAGELMVRGFQVDVAEATGGKDQQKAPAETGR